MLKTIHRYWLILVFVLGFFLSNTAQQSTFSLSADTVREGDDDMVTITVTRTACDTTCPDETVSKYTVSGDQSIVSEILGIRNTCAASDCLRFPDASWEKVNNFVVVLIGLLTRKQ